MSRFIVDALNPHHIVAVGYERRSSQYAYEIVNVTVPTKPTILRASHVDEIGDVEKAIEPHVGPASASDACRKVEEARLRSFCDHEGVAIREYAEGCGTTGVISKNYGAPPYNEYEHIVIQSTGRDTVRVIDRNKMHAPKGFEFGDVATVRTWQGEFEISKREPSRGHEVSR